MLTGEAVRTFTVMFLKMWDLTEKTENMALYLKQDLQPASEKEHAVRPYHEAQAEGFVLPYGENPFAADRTAERVYLEILNCATRYVHIMTPYLVPDQELLQALCYAAKRGVDVKLILPLNRFLKSMDWKNQRHGRIF